MDQVDSNLRRRRGLPGRFSAKLTIAALASVSVVAIALPATAAYADPVSAPASPTAPPASPNAAPDSAPVPADPNPAPPPPTDPNAGNVANPAGGFSFALPPGWVESDAVHLDYGSALLSKVTGEAAPGQPPPIANDTRIVLGRLDQRLYASAEADNGKAATRLASDMGEFFMPYPGTRINQETIALNANGMAGSAAFYEVKFSDPAKPNGQIWAGVVGSSLATTPNATAPQRWFVVWLGTANAPVDKTAAKILAESIRPWAPPSAAPTEPGPAPAASPSSTTPGADLPPVVPTQPQTTASA
ncbi:MAG: hypothetical protein K2Q25_03155 [Mycobacteriaceae bacterium]|nr:hypothetical protein [Mycobacteriaceae bacterium]